LNVEIEQRDRQIAEMQQKLDLLSAKLAASQEKPRDDAPIEKGQFNLATGNFSDALSEKSVEAVAIVQPPKSVPVKSGRVKPLNYGAIPPNAEAGLNQTELCEFYGLSWRNLKRNCDSAGFSNVIDYFAAMTGIQWEPCESAGQSKRYAPIEVTTNQARIQTRLTT
jgi:hypothetical protein